MKFYEVQERLNGVIEFINKGITLPIKVSYAINKTRKALIEEAKTFEEERTKLIHLYAEKDESGEYIVEDGNYKIIPEHATDFSKGYNDLLNLEVDVQITQFSIEDLNGFNLSVLDLDRLDFMIKE